MNAPILELFSNIPKRSEIAKVKSWQYFHSSNGSVRLDVWFNKHRNKNYISAKISKQTRQNRNFNEIMGCTNLM